MVKRLIDLLTGTRRWLLKQSVFTSVILPAIPRPIRWALRRLYFLPFDLLGRGKEGPKRSTVYSGSMSQFEESGRRLVEVLTEIAGLTPDSRVLDIGCGNGRLALALRDHLSPQGRYDGLDVAEPGIRWGSETITPEHPNFRFTRADVFNKEYNPSGTVRPAEYVLPYADGSMDVVVLSSVFTHMLPEDVEHYVDEISRVLAPGGRCLATFFLVNEDAQRRMDAGESSFRFRHRLGPHWVVNRRVPELSVGYEEDHVRALFADPRRFASFDVHYGGWCGRPPFWSPNSGPGDQDVVLAVR